MTGEARAAVLRSRPIAASLPVTPSMVRKRIRRSVAARVSTGMTNPLMSVICEHPSRRLASQGSSGRPALVIWDQEQAKSIDVRRQEFVGPPGLPLGSPTTASLIDVAYPGAYFARAPAQFRSPQALPLGRTSRGRHGPAIDDILSPGDEGGARRSQKCDKVSDLSRLCRTAKRDTAKRVHHNLAAAFVVGGVLSRDLLD